MSDEYEHQRKVMVQNQLLQRDISSVAVLEAFKIIPRHLFVPKDKRHLAYNDSPLHIGSSQTISQPYMVAIMTELLSILPNDKVLEIGSGSGYQAAILSVLADQVLSVERIPELAEFARKNLATAEITNVEVITGDGSLGCAEKAPFDKIIVTAAAPHLPSLLNEQLSDGGKIVIPVGSRHIQKLKVITKQGEELVSKASVSCRFVPLLGEDGWQE